MSSIILRQPVWSRLLELKSAEFDVCVTHTIPHFPHLELYQPYTDDARPTILALDPLTHTNGATRKFFAHRFAERGYCVILQTVAACDFPPHIKHHQATVAAWATTQPWSNGETVTWHHAISAIRVRRACPPQRVKTHAEICWFS